MRNVYDPDYQFMLSRLKEARRTKDLTQVQVAKALKVHQSFVSKCEQGERRLDVIELWRFALLYDQPLTFFVPDSPAKKPKTKR